LEKRELWAQKLFKNMRDVTLFDSFVHPQVSFHSIQEVYGWAHSNKFLYVGSWPPIELSYYTGLFLEKINRGYKKILYGDWNYLSIFFFIVEAMWVMLGKSVMVNVTVIKK